jgi:hypothetical protein
MDAQQLHDYIIKPTLQYMGGNYYSKESAFLLLCTASIESNCGKYIKQINGPALGIFQMEPDTYGDIIDNCDAINENNIKFYNKINSLWNYNGYGIVHGLVTHPMYACAMARLKYSMDPNPLPKLTGVVKTDLKSFYDYYKRVYNTELGASTYDKWCIALDSNGIMEVKL